MATILPHTTRATGTVLTAAIYNTDHQNHITNANALNSELGTVTSDVAAIEADIDARLDEITGMFSMLVLVPANQTYMIDMKIPFGCTVVETTCKTGAGTCTVQYTINAVNIGGAAHSATTSEVSVARSSANVIAADDDFKAVVTAVAACTSLSLSAKYTRAL